MSRKGKLASWHGYPSLFLLSPKALRRGAASHSPTISRQCTVYRLPLVPTCLLHQTGLSPSALCVHLPAPLEVCLVSGDNWFRLCIPHCYKSQLKSSPKTPGNLSHLRSLASRRDWLHSFQQLISIHSDPLALSPVSPCT